MKHKSILFIICLVTFFSCKEAPKEQVQKETIAATAIESSEPKSTFEDLEGNPVELSDYAGKKILLNFWATWCRPCIEEMPDLLKAEVALANDNYVFLLASDQSMEKIIAFKEKKGFDFKYLKFNGAMADFKVNALPATFIYNEAGKKVDRIDGATDWDTPEIIDMLKAVK